MNLIIYLCVLGRINVILGRYFVCVCVYLFIYLQWIINAIKEKAFFKSFGFGKDRFNFRSLSVCILGRKTIYINIF